MEVGPTIIAYKSPCLIISEHKVTRRTSLGVKRNWDTSRPCSFMSKFSQWEIQPFLQFDSCLDAGFLR